MMEEGGTSASADNRISLSLSLLRRDQVWSMKYVALLSGGKDSCFNLVHCSQNGHELVAAASLGPGKGKGGDSHPSKF